MPEKEYLIQFVVKGSALSADVVAEYIETHVLPDWPFVDLVETDIKRCMPYLPEWPAKGE